MRNMMNTITLITIRDTPQTISLMMYQRILTIQRKQRNRNANTASPMDCAVCLMLIAAVILEILNARAAASSSVSFFLVLAS